MSLYALTNVFYNSEADGAARLVLLAIADCANDECIAWPSLPTLAVKAHVSKDTARRKIEDLIKLGELEILEKGDGRKSTIYRVILRPNHTISTGGNLPPPKNNANGGLQFATPGVAQPCYPRGGTAMPPELPSNGNRTITPIVPLYKKTENSNVAKKISPPHSQMAAVAAHSNAPTSAPPPSAAPLTLGLGGADAPPIVAAVGGVEAQDGIAAVAAIPEQPVIEVHAGSEPLTQPTSTPGVHVEKGAARDENPALEAVKLRLGALFGRPAASPWSDVEKRALRGLMPVPDADLSALEFLVQLNKDLAFKPRSLSWLLKNWGYVLDQARPLHLRSLHKSNVVVSEYQFKLDSLRYLFCRLTDNSSDSEFIVCACNYLDLPKIFQDEFCSNLSDEQQLLLTTIMEKYYEWKKT